MQPCHCTVALYNFTLYIVHCTVHFLQFLLVNVFSLNCIGKLTQYSVNVSFTENHKSINVFSTISHSFSKLHSMHQLQKENRPEKRWFWKSLNWNISSFVCEVNWSLVWASLLVSGVGCSIWPKQTMTADQTRRPTELKYITKLREIN